MTNFEFVPKCEAAPDRCVNQGVERNAIQRHTFAVSSEETSTEPAVLSAHAAKTGECHIDGWSETATDPNWTSPTFYVRPYGLLSASNRGRLVCDNKDGWHVLIFDQKSQN